MTPIADIDRIARCIGNRTQYPWRFSKLFVPQLRASRRSKRKRGRDNCRHFSEKLKKRKRLESEIAKHESTDPDIIAAEIDSRFPNRSPSWLPVNVVRP